MLLAEGASGVAADAAIDIACQCALGRHDEALPTEDLAAGDSIYCQ